MFELGEISFYIDKEDIVRYREDGFAPGGEMAME